MAYEKFCGKLFYYFIYLFIIIFLLLTLKDEYFNITMKVRSYCILYKINTIYEEEATVSSD